MANPHTLLTKVSQKLRLPTDIGAGLPRLELNGFCECSLDCHSGILEYEREQIVVALNIGTVTIRGQGLQLQQMHRDRLCVTGKLQSLEFSQEAG